MSAVPSEAPLRRGFFTRRPGGAGGTAPAQPPTPRPAGDLPERHGGLSFAVLGRGPTVAFATWDLPHGVEEGWTVEIHCEGADGAARAFSFPAQAHSAYLQGLQPGGWYQVRPSLRSPEGAVRALQPAVSVLALPPAAAGEGTVRFARAPWAPGAGSRAAVPAGIAKLPSTFTPLPTSQGGTGPAAGAAPPLPTSPGAQ